MRRLETVRTEPDGGDGRAEYLQVLRQEAPPEILAEREQKHCDGDGNNVALESEGLDDA